MLHVLAMDTQAKKTTDFLLTSHGSVSTLLPLTEAARSWVSEHLPEAPTLGRNIVIEARFVADVYEGASGDGLDFTVH